jgi:hypothetical protein
MPNAPDRIAANTGFAAQELIDAPADQHPAMFG